MPFRAMRILEKLAMAPGGCAGRLHQRIITPTPHHEYAVPHGLQQLTLQGASLAKWPGTSAVKPKNFSFSPTQPPLYRVSDCSQKEDSPQ